MSVCVFQGGEDTVTTRVNFTGGSKATQGTLHPFTSQGDTCMCVCVCVCVCGVVWCGVVWLEHGGCIWKYGLHLYVRDPFWMFVFQEPAPVVAPAPAQLASKKVNLVQLTDKLK